ncbi:1-phosphofructokinase family hexose kinase [Frateuria defendens]|uniref:1-phosphofructokinase family hexose kinase n=1 Tax=Frateuria defendens TaxID=2219559 RepID=UPI00066FEA95|nr:1-phosphofructokinase family hexose kinase [Frateuria defendens]
MITVAGFNTAIDRLVSLDALAPGHVQRARAASAYPGGKGLHVAQTVAALGERVQLVGLTDPLHRNLIGRRLAERGVLFHGVEIGQALRQCIALREPDGRITEILDPGPEPEVAARERLLDGLLRCAEESALVVLAGSLPRGFGTDTYASLARQVVPPSLVDASGEVLRQAIAAGVHLVKANRDEAAEWSGRRIDSAGEAAAVARAMHERGVARPVVTLGVQGAVGFDGATAWHVAVATTHSRNAVGSGDCFMAGMAVALRHGEPLEEALRLGAACGAANALGEETGYVRREDVDALLSQVVVRRLDG